MTDEPQIWHYGLMAERWAKSINDTPELVFYEKQIEKFGQPVLDVACGTGRLLLALLRAGIDMDGCDLSKDMLQFCRQRVQQEGFHAHLMEQPMHAFQSPRTYKTIYVCDSFGLAGSREKDLETLRCCYGHLESGGALIFNIQAEYADPGTWQLWLEENRQHLPQAWPQEGSRRVAADGVRTRNQHWHLPHSSVRRSHSRGLPGHADPFRDRHAKDSCNHPRRRGCHSPGDDACHRFGDESRLQLLSGHSGVRLPR